MFKQPLTCYIAKTFRENVVVTDELGEPIKFDGYSARMQVRDDYGGTIVIEMTTENGHISFDRNTITLFIQDEDTALFTSGSYKYDLNVNSPSGDVYPIMYGAFKIKDSVTV